MVTTSEIIENLELDVRNYDGRNFQWCDSIWKYDLFMGDIRPYWLKRTHYNYQELLRNEEFIGEVKNVLKALGMDRRGSTITSIGLILDTTIEASQDFELLRGANIRLETLNLKKEIEGEKVASIIERIYNLFSQRSKLSLSGGMVIASKTMHVIMPELFIMIDHRIMSKLHKISDYNPHPSDAKSWHDIFPDYSDYTLNPASGDAWDLDQCYLVALMYYKRLILEWCQRNNKEIKSLLDLGVRTIVTDRTRGEKIKVKTTAARIIDMALW